MIISTINYGSENKINNDKYLWKSLQREEIRNDLNFVL